MLSSLLFGFQISSNDHVFRFIGFHFQLSNQIVDLVALLQKRKRVFWFIIYHTPVSQIRWEPQPTGKTSPKFVPGEEKPLRFHPYWEKWSITIPTVEFSSEFAVPTELLDLKTMEINIPIVFKSKGFFIPSLAIKIPPGQWKQGWCIHYLCNKSRIPLLIFTVMEMIMWIPFTTDSLFSKNQKPKASLIALCKRMIVFCKSVFCKLISLPNAV